MLRLAIFAIALISVIQLSVFKAAAQTFSRGVPASAMSPEPDGRQHGVPASAVSPVPLPPGVHPQRQFFNNNNFGNLGPRRKFFTQRNRGNVFVPVPVFYPIYGYGGPSYPVADPYVPATQDPTNNSSASASSADDAAPTSSDHDLQAAYLQGARDALAHERDKVSGNGDRYADSHDRAPSHREPSSAPPAEAAPQPAKDNSPATVFIFKDGHQIETKNFAIVGQMLYDFSDSGLKKVQLSDMDKDATTKANDDRGISVKLP